MERVNILNFNNIFSEYSPEFIQFIDKYNIKAPSLKKPSGQGIALLTCKENRNKYVLREDLEVFFKNLNMHTKDAIQCVNKCEQWGLKRGETKGKYQIPYPFIYYSLHINKRKNMKIEGDRNEVINTMKKFIEDNYINVPNNLWQIGHKNPFLPTSKNNIIYQPPIQSKYSNRYKFDDLGLTKFPTTSELIKNFDKYYDENEQKELFNHLQLKFVGK